MNKEHRQIYSYHIYIDLVGEEILFQPLFDFLVELRARKISDYPIWRFESYEKRDFFTEKLSEVMSLIPVIDEGLGLVETRWHVLIMGNNGHGGFSRGFTPEQYENLMKSGQ